MPNIDIHGMTNFQIIGECVIAFCTFGTMVFSVLNNFMGHRQAAKQDATIQKVDAVHELANGTTSSLTTALKIEQDKNAELQKMLAAALLGRRSTDNVATEPIPPK